MRNRQNMVFLELKHKKTLKRVENVLRQRRIHLACFFYTNRSHSQSNDTIPLNYKFVEGLLIEKKLMKRAKKNIYSRCKRLIFLNSTTFTARQLVATHDDKNLKMPQRAQSLSLLSVSMKSCYRMRMQHIEIMKKT
jgi:hypothetical protein